MIQQGPSLQKKLIPQTGVIGLVITIVETYSGHQTHPMKKPGTPSLMWESPIKMEDCEDSLSMN